MAEEAKRSLVVVAGGRGAFEPGPSIDHEQVSSDEIKDLKCAVALKLFDKQSDVAKIVEALRKRDGSKDSLYWMWRSDYTAEQVLKEESTNKYVDRRQMVIFIEIAAATAKTPLERARGKMLSRKDGLIPGDEELSKNKDGKLLFIHAMRVEKFEESFKAPALRYVRFYRFCKRYVKVGR